MKDLFLPIESLEGRTLFSVDVTPMPGGPPELLVQQGDVSISITPVKIFSMLSVQTPGTDLTQFIGGGFIKK